MVRAGIHPSVAVWYTAAPDRTAAGRIADEFELSEAAHNVAAAIPGATMRPILGAPREILALIEACRPDVVFNLCEAPAGRPDWEAHVAALLEWSGVRFTGCRSETLSLCRRKPWVNAVLRDAGIPVPAPVDPANPRFPCIVKPAAEDGSAGIDRDSVCWEPAALDRAVERCGNLPMIEEFLPGREFAVSLWGPEEPAHLSVGEVIYAHDLPLVTYAAKWLPETSDFRDSPMDYATDIEPDLRLALERVARAVWRAVAARHVLRVDIRLCASGGPHVLDVNPNPEISPGVGICRAVQEAGWRWEDFVRSLVAWA